jgi:hypothetical protein
MELAQKNMLQNAAIMPPPSSTFAKAREAMLTQQRRPSKSVISQPSTPSSAKISPAVGKQTQRSNSIVGGPYINEDMVLALTLQAISPAAILKQSRALTPSSIEIAANIEAIQPIATRSRSIFFEKDSYPWEEFQRTRSLSVSKIQFLDSNHYEQQSDHRPQTAPSQSRTDIARETLIRKPGREFGLPADVFENPHDKVSLKVGLKFLKAMASKPGLYDDVKVKKRKKGLPPTST